MYMNVLAKITKNKEFYFNFWRTNRTYDDEYCKQYKEVVELAGSIAIPLLNPPPLNYDRLVCYIPNSTVSSSYTHLKWISFSLYPLSNSVY